MKIILASDHRGFQLKESLKHYLVASSPRRLVADVGPISYDPQDDYIDYAQKAIEYFQPDDRLILLCGSGHGMDIAANRVPYLRAIMGFNPDVVEQGRQHEDANVLIIPADWTTEAQAKIVVDTFLETPFSDEDRHLRRLDKLKKVHF